MKQRLRGTLPTSKTLPGYRTAVATLILAAFISGGPTDSLTEPAGTPTAVPADEVPAWPFVLVHPSGLPAPVGPDGTCGAYSVRIGLWCWAD